MKTKKLSKKKFSKYFHYLQLVWNFDTNLPNNTIYEQYGKSEVDYIATKGLFDDNVLVFCFFFLFPISCFLFLFFS